MGSGLLSFFQTKIKKTWKMSFSFTFILGLLIYLYKFTNVIPNSDAVKNFYSSQNMVASGRWLLAVACGFSSFFDLPWINGLTSLLFIGVTAAIITEIFDMKNPVVIFLSSGLLVSFPAIWITMAYGFTADGYMIAMALAALSVYLTRMQWISKAHWKKSLLSGICICMACGIYQAYVSFAYIFAVCYFMVELLENRWDRKTYLRWIGTQIVIYVGAMAAYYGIWKLCLSLQGVAVTPYLGMDQIGSVGKGLGHVVVMALKTFLLFFAEWNFLEKGLTIYSALNIVFLLFFGTGMTVAVIKSGCIKQKMNILLLVACLLSIPVGCCVWLFASSGVIYHALMFQSICGLYIFTVVLFDRWIHPKISNLLMIVLIMYIFNNAVSANIYYNYMHQTIVKTNATATEISTRIHLHDSGKEKYIVFYGELAGWKEEDYNKQDKLLYVGPARTLLQKNLLSAHYLSLYTDFDLSYYRIHNEDYPLVERGTEWPVPFDQDFRFPLLGEKEKEELGRTEEVKNMPIWPAEGSVKRIGEVIVVKLSEFDIDSSK